MKGEYNKIIIWLSTQCHGNSTMGKGMTCSQQERGGGTEECMDMGMDMGMGMGKGKGQMKQNINSYFPSQQKTMYKALKKNTNINKNKNKNKATMYELKFEFIIITSL